MSCDFFLGIPFNIASYGLLLEILAKVCGLKAGKLIGFLGDVHIYDNHLPQITEQLGREPYPSPKLELADFESIDDWSWDLATLDNYQHHPTIKGAIAI